MDLLKGVTKAQLGIEIGPWFKPLVPKAEGYNSLSLDVFDEAQLKQKALDDPSVPKAAISKIEPVDLVGSVTRLAEMLESKSLVGKLDYVISSHNFEHVPDPIRFLQACELGLKPGGLLIMAVPDRRTCFDYFRPYSITADFISAYFDAREQPSASQVFVRNSLHSRLCINGEEHIAFYITDDPSLVKPYETLKEAYREWKGMIESPDDVYRDTHCWAFTPSSLELIINDLSFLGLTRMSVHSIVGPNGCEFHVRLAKPTETSKWDDKGFYLQRANLLHRINDEASANSVATFNLRHESSNLNLQINELKQRIAELDTQLTDRNEQLKAMHESTSWRITAPLRSLAKRVR
jgi:SAM-dependent methyltransferase